MNNCLMIFIIQGSKHIGYLTKMSFRIIQSSINATCNQRSVTKMQTKSCFSFFCLWFLLFVCIHQKIRIGCFPNHLTQLSNYCMHVQNLFKTFCSFSGTKNGLSLHKKPYLEKQSFQLYKMFKCFIVSQHRLLYLQSCVKR